MRSDTRDGFGKLVSQAVAVPLQRLVVDLCCSVLLWSSTPSRDSHNPLGQGQSTCAQARSHPGVRRRDKTLRERPHCLLLLVLETPRGPPCPVCCHQLSPAPAVPVQTHLPSLGTASAGRGWHRPAWGTPPHFLFSWALPSGGQAESVGSPKAGERVTLIPRGHRHCHSTTATPQEYTPQEAGRCVQVGTGQVLAPECRSRGDRCTPCTLTAS